MPKTTNENLAILTSEIARVLDGRGSRPFDGHVVVDFDQADGKIGGRVLHAHDSAEVLTFTVQVQVS
jgi:hypothetical protein